jgi:type VI protein secretion system component Hcp
MLIALAALCLGVAAAANGAENVLMQIEGTETGRFANESTRNPQGGSPLEAWSYSVAYATDPAENPELLASARRYAPVSFEKLAGAASPQILRAFMRGEPLQITVDVLTIDSRTGSTLLMHRVRFFQARILSVTRSTVPPPPGSSSLAQAQLRETVTFNFGGVEFDPGHNASVTESPGKL